MRLQSKYIVGLLAVAAVGLVAMLTTAQAPAPSDVPRFDGRPNLNGIWQAMNNANWDLQSHPWKISMPLYRHVEKNAQLLDFKCVEFVEELMWGHLRKQGTE